MKGHYLEWSWLESLLSAGDKLVECAELLVEDFMLDFFGDKDLERERKGFSFNFGWDFELFFFFFSYGDLSRYILGKKFMSKASLK